MDGDGIHDDQPSPSGAAAEELDAPSTSQQQHDQGAGGAYGGSMFQEDDFLEDMAPASDFQQLKKASLGGGSAVLLCSRSVAAALAAQKLMPFASANAGCTQRSPTHMHAPTQNKQALFNERLAPEILAYQGELVDRVRERIEQQVRRLLGCMVACGRMQWEVVSSSIGGALL